MTRTISGCSLTPAGVPRVAADTDESRRREYREAAAAPTGKQRREHRIVKLDFLERKPLTLL
eukprot:scaffold52901_cov28-Attheya_sp.AAC.1